MKNIDLDEVLKETRGAIRAFSEIDIDDRYSEVSIGKIMFDIEEKSKSIIESNEVIKPQIHVTVNDVNPLKNNSYLRNIDNKLNNLSIYRNTIRPKIKNRMGFFLNKKTIDGQELLKFEGATFVDVLYRSILSREAEDSAKENAIEFLRNPDTSKVDLIYNIVNSEEGKSKKIRVKGIKARKLLLDIKRAIYSFPILGYVFRLVVYLCLLPKKLKHIQYMVYDISGQIRVLDSLIKASNMKEGVRTNTEEINRLKTYISELDKRTKEVEYFAHKLIDSESEKAEKLKREKLLIDKFYVRYNEVLMPDSREDIKNRLRIYIDKLNNYFEETDKKELFAVDLGCGEGEWIELLYENGFDSIGVDNNSSVVKKVRGILPNTIIVENDAFDYLKNLEDDTIDLLTSFHMVEHLEMIEIIELLSECRRVLKSGGMLIIETPNPLNILTSTYYFNMDPTHKKPIPPELLAFFISETGFEIKEKVLLYPLNFIPYEYKADDPIKDIVYRFNMEQAYSVLAVKEQ